jgi:hypothetical protein
MKVSVELHDYAEMRYIDVKATNPFCDGNKDPPSMHHSIIEKKKTIFFQNWLLEFLVFDQNPTQT